MARSSCTARKQTRPGTWASRPGSGFGLRDRACAGQSTLLEQLGSLAQRLKTRAYLVGGPVRDRLLGLDSPDLDVAVESHASRFCRALAVELGGRHVFHRRFLSGTVLGADGVRIDVSQTRTETYARPAVLPAVEPAGIEQDLRRRDFSVNAMAMELVSEGQGRLIDPLGGRQDLALRSVRVLHERSFADDPTRIFRCLRFAVRLGFEIEPGTLRLLRDAVQARFAALLTPERILYELRLVCSETLVLRVVEALAYEQVLKSAWGWKPGKRFLPGLARLVQHRVPSDLLFVYWLSFLPVTDRFPVTREERDAAAWLGRFEPVCGRLCRSTRPSTIYRLLQPIPEPALRVLAVLEPDVSARRIRLYLDRLAGVRTQLTGRDLRELGVEPGPQYRKILDRLLWARLDGCAGTREQELALCHRMLARSKAR